MRMLTIDASKRAARFWKAGMVFILGAGVGAWLATAGAQEKPPAQRCYELRVYTAADGKLDAVNARFKDHTDAIFKKHGMTSIGYWTPTDDPAAKNVLPKNTLVYIMSYPSLAARDQAWKDFAADPDWVAARTESEKNGKIVQKVESTILTPTNYSPLK